MKHFFICEDSMEGIFTGIYVAWASKVGHENVELIFEEMDQGAFFCEYHHVKKDLLLAEKVRRTLERTCGYKEYEILCYSACSYDPERGTALYQTVVSCLDKNRKMVSALDDLRNPYVLKVNQLYKNVWYEYHHYLGFIRFKEFASNALVAVIEPKNQILTLFAPHFSDRLPMENWMILDKKRKQALMHEAQKPCRLFSGQDLKIDKWEELFDVEEDFETLWAGFCKSIAIKERQNLKLQRQNLPIRFRENMTEFSK